MSAIVLPDRRLWTPWDRPRCRRRRPRRRRRFFDRFMPKWMRLPVACSGCGQLVCCCTGEYRQLRDCDTDELVDLYISTAGLVDPITLYNFNDEQCYYWFDEDPTTTTPGTILESYFEVGEYNDGCLPCFFCGNECEGCGLNSTPDSFTVTFSDVTMDFTSCTAASECYVKTTGTFDGTFSVPQISDCQWLLQQSYTTAKWGLYEYGSGTPGCTEGTECDDPPNLESDTITISITYSLGSWSIIARLDGDDDPCVFQSEVFNAFGIDMPCQDTDTFDNDYDATWTGDGCVLVDGHVAHGGTVTITGERCDPPE